MLINKNDNVTVDLATGHKNARFDIAKGEQIIKYGFPIGVASRDIKAGEHVHSHNIRTGLGEILEYTYEPSFNLTVRSAYVTTYGSFPRSVASTVRLKLLPKKRGLLR